MSAVFRIEVLPAQRGDALWIDYGPREAPRHILIDGGITQTGRTLLVDKLKQLGADAHIALLVVTHIDLDHIQGVIALLKALPPNVTIDRVWFNGWDQLPKDPLQPMGVKQGMELADLLKAKHAAQWNAEAGGGAICLRPDGSAPAFDLDDGLVVTVLSPDAGRLVALREIWDDVVEAFGAGESEAEAEPDSDALEGLERMGAEEIDVRELAQRRFTEDDKAPNGSSIAVMLTFAGKRALMLGDAHPSLLLKTLQTLSSGPLHVDCVKLSHHGSRNNTSRELVQHLRSPRWIFSSNGVQTKHPNLEAVARVLLDAPGRKSLVFNYKTGFNEMWDSPSLQHDHDYEPVYGDGEKPVVVDLLAEAA